MLNSTPMKIRLKSLTEPNLIFGGNFTHIDPKIALAKAGPVDRRQSEIKRISLGMVGPEAEIDEALKWFSRLDKPLMIRQITHFASQIFQDEQGIHMPI